MEESEVSELLSEIVSSLKEDDYDEAHSLLDDLGEEIGETDLIEECKADLRNGDLDSVLLKVIKIEEEI